MKIILVILYILVFLGCSTKNTDLISKKIYKHNKMSAVYYNQSSYDKAIKEAKKALSYRVLLVGENDIKVAGDYKYIGNIYLKNEDYTKAIECFNKGLEIALNNSDNKGSLEESLKYQIAKAQYLKKDFNKPLKYFNRVLDYQLSKKLKTKSSYCQNIY